MTKMTPAQRRILQEMADGSYWGKPARAGHRPAERKLIEMGYVKNWQVTDAGKRALTA